MTIYQNYLIPLENGSGIFSLTERLHCVLHSLFSRSIRNASASITFSMRPLNLVSIVCFKERNIYKRKISKSLTFLGNELIN